MEKMNRTICFFRENNDFSDILNDKVLKRKIKHKFQWDNHLMIVFSIKTKAEVFSYLGVKYGDSIVAKNSLIKDRMPVKRTDYYPTIRDI